MAEQLNGFLEPKTGFATTAIHTAQDPESWISTGVVPPITLSTTFKQPAPGEPVDFEYSRSDNPSRRVLEQCLAKLEDGKHGVACSSGLGTITIVGSLLSQGDHIVCCDDVYGGTTRIFKNVFSRFGIETTFVDFTNPKNVTNALRPNTKMLWFETPTNPLLKVVDIEEIVKIGKKHHKDTLIAVDNTFLSSYFQRPLNFEADIVVHSLTKFMNGHSDVIMGAAIVNSDELAERMRYLQNAMGVVPSPFDCYLVNRSLKTLHVRMEFHKKSALKIAQWMEKHDKIQDVLHPGLKSHPQHAIALKQSSGHSGVFSFRHIGGLQESRTLLSSLKVFTLAESLGGYESLAELPCLMTHSQVPEEQRNALGITDSLIRLSVGLEDTEDLIADLNQAIQKAFKQI